MKYYEIKAFSQEKLHDCLNLLVNIHQIFKLLHAEQVYGVSIQADLLQSTANQTASSCIVGVVCPKGRM